MQEEISMDDFELADESITTAMLDEEVGKLKAYKDDYEEKKKESDKAHGDYNTQRLYLVSLLSKAGKKKYEAEGIGTIYVSSKLKVKYPQDIEGRQSFLEYVKGRYGEEAMANLVSVNYQTLQSFYNEEFQAAAESGDASTFQIPGIKEPESEVTLSFRKSK